MKKCNFCNIKYKEKEGAKGLCHKHINAFYRIDNQRVKIYKRLKQMAMLEEIVIGKINLTTNGSSPFSPD